MTNQPWQLHPDRALPAEPQVRVLARQIYQSVAELPLVCMHTHVEAQQLAENSSFGNPAELFVIPDHYLTRMLNSQGIPLADLGRSPDGAGDPREIWRLFCANWHLFRGTPTRYWLEHELVEVFGVTQRPSAATADAIYDHLSERLADSDWSIRNLFDRFNIETLATTDAAESDLRYHQQLAQIEWGEKVVPTFRPDGLVYLDRPNWRADIDKLAEASGVDVTSYDTFLTALRQRREAFRAMGARASDHGHTYADATPLDPAEVREVFDHALAGELVDGWMADVFAAHMLTEFAGMAADDGLVMQLHVGVRRNHSTEILDRYGPDAGFDIPVSIEFTDPLRPLLERYGHAAGFRMILFTVDETVYSRELAPLAGAYPTVKLGAPWWFLDSPGGMMRYRDRVTETAGFYNTTGFVDDTRAFCSIPARHDLARRIDAGYLAKLVAEHRLDLDEALEVAADLAYHLPRAAYARLD